MNTSLYFIFLALIIILVSQQNNRNMMLQRKKIRKKKKEEMIEMVELAKKFIDKDCIINTCTNRGYVGIIKEVSNTAILVENNNVLEAVNLEFVMSIKEYPKNKKGKRKVLAC